MEFLDEHGAKEVYLHNCWEAEPTGPNLWGISDSDLVSQFHWLYTKGGYRYWKNLSTLWEEKLSTINN